MTKSDLTPQAHAVWTFLSHFPGTKVPEAPRGLEAAVMKLLKGRR